MKIFLGADHRGLELKTQIISQLKKRKIEYSDLGAYETLPEDDYNEYATMVAREVLSSPGSFGILVCGSAQGVCMQANRFKGIRAAFCRTTAEAKITREHNDANILCLSADQDQPPSTYYDIVETFISTNFLNIDRYTRRNQKLDEEQL